MVDLINHDAFPPVRAILAVVHQLEAERIEPIDTEDVVYHLVDKRCLPGTDRFHQKDCFVICAPSVHRRIQGGGRGPRKHLKVTVP